jgi:Na+/H+-dicarboxylate symporter
MSAEAIVSSIFIAVVSGLIMEAIREHRKKGKQFLERCYDSMRDLISWVLQRLAR